VTDSNGSGPANQSAELVAETCRSSWAAIHLTFIKTGSRPNADIRLSELVAVKQSLVRASREQLRDSSPLVGSGDASGDITSGMVA